jgi:hypothetical protein
LLPDHFNPGPPRIGGCFTCRYCAPPLGDLSNPLADHRRACSRPRTWPATLPANGCSGWEREPDSDDEIRPR